MRDLGLRRRAEAVLGAWGRLSGILMYHRIASERHDPWRLCVSPAAFGAQLAAMKQVADVIDLSALNARRHRTGRLRLAVTFDDGYRDNLTHALPVLERHDVPATVFVVSGQLGSTREFWWDALERIVLATPTLPDELSLVLSKRSYRWELKPEAPGDEAWSPELKEPKTSRQKLFLELWSLLVLCETAERDHCLDELSAWACAGGAPAERLAMTEDDIVSLARHPLIRIGCHTVGHRSLPQLPLLVQRREIADCRRRLERLTGYSVTVFSYPYGRLSARTWGVVKQLGFELACTSRPGPVSSLADSCALPRLQVIEESGQALLQRIASLVSLRMAGAAHV